MSSVLIRIALRWIAGALVSHGLLGEGMTGLFDDPDIAMVVETGIGVAIGAIAEGWYYLANRFGWAK